ncbi:MAG: hypothetical protein HYX76_06575 [Acidobacteria bacterium]|nr:hypothetical protein [Acidobacteriota bacterium]
MQELELRRWRHALKLRLAPLGIVAAVCAISLLHYGTSVHWILLHEIFKRLYYVPIVIAAVAYGTAAGLATSILASLLYLPHIVLDWRGLPVFAVERYGELVLFNVVAGVTGFLADRLRAEGNRYREAATELQEAYCHLKARTEERLRVDRLVTVGRIASGIAHEIRNPLGGILGCIEILEAEFPRLHPKREFFGIARKEMRRLDAVVGEFLEFAEPAPPSSRSINLNEIVRSASRLARPSLAGRAVTFHLETSAAALPAVVDAEQVQRAVLNLILAATSELGDTRVDPRSCRRAICRPSSSASTAWRQRFRSRTCSIRSRRRAAATDSPSQQRGDSSRISAEAFALRGSPALWSS